MIVRLDRFRPHTFRDDEGRYGVKVEKHWIVLLYHGLKVLIAGVVLTTVALWVSAPGWPVVAAWGADLTITSWFALSFYDLAHTFIVITPKRVYRFRADGAVEDPPDYVAIDSDEGRTIDWSSPKILGWALRMADITFTVSGDRADLTFTNAYFTDAVRASLNRLTP